MKKIFIEQIRERDRVESVFLVRDKTTAMAKNGKPYMTLKLMDRSGEVEGRIWDRVDEFSGVFEKDDFILVSAKASVYLGKMQLIVQDLEKVPEQSLNLADFLPVSSRSLDEMRVELDRLLDSLSDPHIEGLLRAFFDDPDFYARYRRCPAAKGMHHVYLGGLLEHSLAVSALACDIAERYPQVDRDLLISGALLHDVGKVEELAYARSFDYTDEGKLLGHIVIGVQMIEDRVRQFPDFPQELAMMIKHLLLSHHGQYEFGSPKRPKFLEAVILNFIDDLDSKINGVLSHIAREPDMDQPWTGYHRLYDRYFYKGYKGAQGQKPKETPVAPSQTTVARNDSRDREEPRRVNRDPRNSNRPLGATLGDQLREKNLDLFEMINEKGDKD